MSSPTYLPTAIIFISHAWLFIFRANFCVLSYAILAFGSLLAHLLSPLLPQIAGLCVLNVVLLGTHFIAVGFFHPETPRYLFAVKVNKYMLMT